MLMGNAKVTRYERVLASLLRGLVSSIEALVALAPPLINSAQRALSV